VVELADPGRETPDLVAALVHAGARITGVREESPTLEEVYLNLVGEVGERDVPLAAVPEPSVREVAS
jgi:hypothetical protein